MRMFSRQRRKARFLFGLSDILLTVLAFAAAYQTRSLLHLERVFYVIVPTQALLLGFAATAWLLAGLWLGVYERLDAGDPRVILRDSFQQCAYGAVALVLFEFVLRLDLSRPFLALFIGYDWVLLFLFRLFSGAWPAPSAASSAARITSWWQAPASAPENGRGARTLRQLRHQAHRLSRAGPRPRAREIQLAATYKVYPIDRLRNSCATASSTKSSSRWTASRSRNWKTSSCCAMKKACARAWRSISSRT